VRNCVGLEVRTLRLGCNKKLSWLAGENGTIFPADEYFAFEKDPPV